MTRQARRTSESGLYHIVFRGVNHCLLFEEQKDYEKLLEILHGVKTRLSLEVYAYCLMPNHVHLLLKEVKPGDVISAMRKMLTPYALWFNRKYQRSGSLITNRYKSECVETDEYLLTLIRYIHHNPLKAGISKSLECYHWSSYSAYISKPEALVDTTFVLSMFSDDASRALKAFKEFHVTCDTANDTVKDDHSLLDKQRRWDEEIRPELEAAYTGLVPVGAGGLAKQERDEVLSFLRGKGFSIRQIERATGISRGIVAKCRPAGDG